MLTNLTRFTGGIGVSTVVLPLLLLRMSITTESSDQNFWRPANGPYGAYVQSLAVRSDGTAFAGTWGYGVFRSTDNGARWSAANTGLTNKIILSLAVHPSGDIFAGTSSGVFRSINDGDTWTRPDTRMSQNVPALVIKPDGNIFAGTSGFGIYRSINNGVSWDSVNTGLPTRASRNIQAFAIDAGGDIFAGTNGGVFRSANNGASWDSLNTGLTTRTNRNIQTLAINASGDVFAASSGGGVFRLTNSGGWTPINTGLTNKAVTDLLIVASGDIFAGTSGGGIFRSVNNGDSWTPVNIDMANKTVLAFAINSNGEIFVGTSYTIFRLSGNGGSWTEVKNGVIGFDVISLAADSDGRVFAGTRTSFGCGSRGVVFRSENSGETWELANTGLRDEPVNALAVNRVTGDIFSAASDGVSRSSNKGASWSSVNSGLIYRSVQALAIKSNGTLFAGTIGGGVYRSANNGATWSPANAGLSKNIYSLAILPDGNIFAGSDSGRVFRSTNDGGSWTPANLDLTNVSIRALAVFDGNIFAGTTSEGIFRSINNGDAWTEVNVGLTNRSVRTLVISSHGEIFAGTSGGAFRSKNNGESWEPIVNGLTHTSVGALAIAPDGHIFSGTDGGGVFRSEQSIARPPGEIRIVNTEASPGSGVTISVELVAQGDENALGFSLRFDPAVFNNPQANRGKDASAASLNTNTSEAGAGRFGVALALPAGQTFAAGDREIVVVSFNVSASTTVDSTRIDFGDQPIAREGVDVNGNAVPVTWKGGTVALVRSFEADVAPRPDGNGSITVADWVQVGRFAAGLDTARINPNELQRADCAPKVSCGDGRITISDWVQAGRYAAGVDAVIAACGPVSSSSSFMIAQRVERAASKAANSRAVRAINASFAPGQTDSLMIELEAEGDENALGFSLNFDASLLTLKNAVLASGTGNVTLNVNASQSVNGRVGVALALPTGQTFSARNHPIVIAIFSVNPSSTVDSTTITFGDQPVAREVVDANANSVPAAWIDAKITIGMITSVNQSSDEVPTSFELEANYPNPFNPATTITYALPRQVEVKLEIVDLLGRHVRTLVNQTQPAGRYSIAWDGRNEQDQVVASGVYIYRLRAGDPSAGSGQGFVQTRRMALVR
jgi:ligand-binding sensor domain-containing protein